MVTTDGFIISHGLEAVQLLTDQEVKEFIGAYRSTYSLLDVDHPITAGALDFTDYYFEHRRQIAGAMEKAKKVLIEVGKEFGDKFGRYYSFFEGYKLEDAETAIVVLGSTAGTTRVVVDELRSHGVKAGLLKLRVFRPFPAGELADALNHVQAVAVLDRSDSLSTAGGPLFTEVRSALYDRPSRPQVINYIYGLGGRDITPADLKNVYGELQKIAAGGQVQKFLRYLGVRE